MTERDKHFAALLRALTACGADARRLGCPFLANLLAMALLEAALQWDGGHARLDGPRERLETLLATKLRLAIAEAADNVVVSRTGDKA